MDLGKRIAERLKQERKERSLSLEGLAKLSGVSRSMLSQIERGSSSPTVSTLWNLTRALDIDLAHFLDGKTEGGGVRDVVRANRMPTIENAAEGWLLKILSPPHYAGECELYEVTFTPGGALKSEPHGDGCEEHVTVLEGALSVTSGETTTELGAGDTACYQADRAHALQAAGEGARAILMVRNP